MFPDFERPDFRSLLYVKIFTCNLDADIAQENRSFFSAKSFDSWLRDTWLRFYATEIAAPTFHSASNKNVKDHCDKLPLYGFRFERGYILNQNPKG